jgi:hypothetical protein
VTTPAPVFAPTVSTYAYRTPYLTPGEYQNAPTGVDSSNLIPGGTMAQQTAALAQAVVRASAWADTICKKILAATRDTQAGRFRVFRDGTLRIPVDFTPLIAVAAASVGDSPSQIAALADLSVLELGDKVVTLPAFGSSSALSTCYGRAASGTRYAQLTYVNGYANTGVTAAAASGATSVTVANPLAIFPGMTMTLIDGGSTELVTVSPAFVPTVTVAPTAIPLTAALGPGHTANAVLSALPGEIKEAVILLTSAVIKTGRGAESVEMPNFGGQGSKIPTEAHGLEELAAALDLLDNHRRVV